MTITDQEEKIISEVFLIISRNIKGRIPILELCLKYNISESTLTRGFKHVYGKTIYQYHLETAMNYAKELLASGYPVKFITIELGYKTSGSFARAFKKMYGKSPSTFIPRKSMHF